jgi:hypothetical protein
MNKQPQYSIAAQGSSNQNRARGPMHDPCLIGTDLYQCTKGHKKPNTKSVMTSKPHNKRQTTTFNLRTSISDISQKKFKRHEGAVKRLYQ